MKKIEQQVVTDPKDSIIQIYGTHVSECGYCKCQRPSSISYGVVAKSLGADDYLKLMLIGWRRSGTYLYKPAMYVTCCPQYTIRLEASRFVANKAQRQVARRVERFLHSGSILAEPEGQPTGKKSSDHTIGLPAASSSSKHSLTVELVPAENTEERYQLFRKYQVESPLVDTRTDTERGTTTSSGGNSSNSSSGGGNISNSNSSSGGGTSSSSSGGSSNSDSGSPRLAYGTYHQLYRLDGRLIAVGVIDLLPDGLSSVYLFYDPDEHHLALGKYTALREIEFCVQQGLKYYYMGYYIHSCPKMRYKGEYKPSELLCPTALTWHPIERCVPLMERHKFTPFDPELAAQRAAHVLTDAQIPTTTQEQTQENEKERGDGHHEIVEQVAKAEGASVEEGSVENKRHAGETVVSSKLETAVPSSSSSSSSSSSTVEAKATTDGSKAAAARHYSSSSGGGAGDAAVKQDDDADWEDVLESGGEDNEEGEEQEEEEEVNVEKLVKESPLSSFAPRFLWSVSTTTAAEGDTGTTTTSLPAKTPKLTAGGGVTVSAAAHTMASAGSIASRIYDNLLLQQRDLSTAGTVNLLPPLDAILKVPLDFNLGQTMHIDQVRDRYQEIIVPLLVEWLSLAGPELAKKVAVKFA